MDSDWANKIGFSSETGAGEVEAKTSDSKLTHPGSDSAKVPAARAMILFLKIMAGFIFGWPNLGLNQLGR